MAYPKVNGNMIEQYVINLLNKSGYSVEFIDTQCDLSVIDTKIGITHYCEIKSCEKHITDTHANAGYRNGRINIPNDQHDYMKHIDGYYICVLHKDINIIGVQIIRAVDLKIANTRSNIPWTYIFKSRHNYRNNTYNKYKLVIDVQLVV